MSRNGSSPLSCRRLECPGPRMGSLLVCRNSKAAPQSRRAAHIALRAVCAAMLAVHAGLLHG